MKWFKFLVTYLLAPSATVIGLAYGFQKYVIDIAHTAVEPVKTRVSSLENDSKETKAMLRVMAVHMMGAKRFEESLEKEKEINP